MASEISVKITATDSATPTIKSVEAEADRLNATVGDLKGSLAEFDGKSKEVKDSLSKLDAGIRQNSQSLRDLASAFADAADESEKLDISAKMDQVQKDLDQQLRAKKIKLDELIDIDTESAKIKIDIDKIIHVDDDSASKAAKGLLGKLADKLKSSGGQLDPAWGELGGRWGALAGVAAAPALLEVIGGAISAGAGGVGIGAAIALAVRSDADLQKAGKDLGMRLLGGLTQAAHTSMYEPIKATLHDLTDDVDQVTDQWGAAFEKLAPSVRPFVDSIAETLTKLSGVVADIAGDSGPALDAFADGFADLGGSIGELLHTMTEDVEGNADALRTFFGVLSLVVDGINLLVVAAREIGGTFGDLTPTILALKLPLELLGDAFNASQDAMHGFRAVNGDVAESSEEATAQLNQERSALEGLADALKAQTDPAFALIDAQRQLTEAQDAYSAAVKKHGKNSDQAKEATIGLAKASLGLEAAAEKAAGTFDGQVSPALRATMKAAGLTDDQINGVAKSFKNAASAGNKFEDKYEAQVGVRNVAKTISDISKATAAARNFAKDYYARLSVAFSAGGAQKAARGQAHGGIAGQAASGATSSGMTWVGEQGPELVDLPAGSRVWSSADSTRSNSSSARGHGENPRGPLVVRLMLDHREMVQLMIDNLQDYIANQAGGSLDVLRGGFR
jgi:methyl-accepting chemotaxis protein